MAYMSEEGYKQLIEELKISGISRTSQNCVGYCRSA